MNKILAISLILLFALAASAQRCNGVAQWDQTKTYPAGSVVQISGLLYTATKQNFCRNPCYPDAAWDPNPWTLVNTCNVDCSNAPTYSGSQQYAKDAIVKYGGYLYISLWGGNRGNRPDLNSGDWGAWKKLFQCTVCVTIQHDCASVSFSTGTLDAQGRVCVAPGTQVTFTATAQTDAVARVIGSSTKTIVVNSDTTVTFDCEYQVYVTLDGDCVVSPANGVYPFWPSDLSDFSVNVQAPTRPDRQCRINSIKIDGNNVNDASLTDIVVSHTIVTDCECQVCTDLSGDCVLTPAEGHHCFYETDGVGLTITVQAPTRPDRECRINSITLDGVATSSPIVILTGDHTVVTDCECQVCTDISGDCVLTPAAGHHCFYETDNVGLTITVQAPTQADRQCRINSINLDGAETSSPIVILTGDHTVVTDCECQVCVDIQGDCVNTPSSRTCTYATDQVTVVVTVEAPVQPGFICQIDGITVDGTTVQSVVFDPLDADHSVVSDCSCVADCPHFYGCNNTPLYSSAQSQVYNGCDCVKQIFDCPSGPGTAIIFCAPQGATIRCDQNIYDGHLIWEGYAICSGKVVNYSSGTAYVGGSIVNKSGQCYVAKWWTTKNPTTNSGLYQDWRYIGACADLIVF